MSSTFDIPEDMIDHYIGEILYNYTSELKCLRRGIDWTVERERIRFLIHFHELIQDWKGNLPNLRYILAQEEIDWILREAAKLADGQIFIDFIIKTGYKDEPDVDKDGKPLLRRTTAIHRTAVDENEQGVRELFKIYSRFDVNYTDELGLTHFHIACKYGFNDIVEKFLELGQDPNCHEYITGDSPLNYALMNGHKEVVELLLRNGANPNLTNNEGSTPVHIICKRQPNKADELFFKIIDDMQQTVQVDVRDELGLTPLQLAVANLSPVTVNLLIDRGADLSNFVFPPVSYFDNRFDRTQRYSYPFKVALASVALIMIETLEKRGYKLNKSNALTTMTLFAKYEMFEKSADVEKFWYGDGYFALLAKEHMIKPNLSLYDLIQLRSEEVSKEMLYVNKFANSEEYWDLPNMHQKACSLHLCEKMSRGFFRRWALESFSELTRYLLPNLCCEKIIKELKNEDLWRICLATASQSS